jgi:hypothetical protein
MKTQIMPIAAATASPADPDLSDDVRPDHPVRHLLLTYEQGEFDDEMVQQIADRAWQRELQGARIERLKKRLSINGRFAPVLGLASNLEPSRRADWYRQFLEAVRGRRFDHNGRSQIIFLSSDPRIRWQSLAALRMDHSDPGGSTSWRVNPSLVEDIVALYGSKIDDADPDGARSPNNSAIVRVFLSQCWILNRVYRGWANDASSIPDIAAEMRQIILTRGVSRRKAASLVLKHKPLIGASEKADIDRCRKAYAKIYRN